MRRVRLELLSALLDGRLSELDRMRGLKRYEQRRERGGSCAIKDLERVEIELNGKGFPNQANHVSS